jgi:hypothetical protein
MRPTVLGGAGRLLVKHAGVPNVDSYTLTS